MFFFCVKLLYFMRKGKLVYMLESIRNKINQLLEKNKSIVEKEDYMRLVVYIDLLFDFAIGNIIVTKQEE